MSRPSFDPRQTSETLTADDAATIKLLLKLGHQHKRIAALYDCNQGRISEIATGRKHAGVQALDERIRAERAKPPTGGSGVRSATGGPGVRPARSQQWGRPVGF